MNEVGYRPAEGSFVRHLPLPIKRLLNCLYWRGYEARDYVAELVGHLPSHRLRLALYRATLGVRIGCSTSIHRGCRFYHPSRVHIGSHTVINRNVLLDGRLGLMIGNNVSISEGVMLLSLEHNPQSASFEGRGGMVQVHDRAFIGARAIVLPGIAIGEGAVVAAGAVVSRPVAAYTIVAGVPARQIGERTRDLTYQLNYRKFLG